MAVRSDVASAANGFIIEESDATADANFTRTAARASVSAATTTYLRARVRSANWRVNYTNGGTAQTSFRIAYRTSPAPFGETFADFDTDATNVQPVELIGIALPASGGPVAGGTTTNPLAVQGTAAAGSAISGNPVLAGGSDGTNARALSLDTTGALKLAAQSTVNSDAVANTTSIIDSAVPIATQGFVFNGTTYDRLRGTTAGVQVQGAAASGAAKAGNPAQIGGVFNTTQPTVTTGQAVEAQATARGALIVATGVDAFAVNNTQQGTASQNVAQIAGTATVTVAAGEQKVGVEGDVASAVADAGNPVKIGGHGYGAIPTAVAADQRINAYLDREGRQILRPWGAGDFTNVNTPAANTQATTTKAAGAAGVRHVCTGITATFAAGSTAPTAVQLTVALRDGASGAGTILWQCTLALPATAGAMAGITKNNMFIRGTAATAMTLEFSAAGGANTFESVTLEGVDITEA